ncbi:MAG: GlxA family transcriptional regulator [Motiliproteus sp.]
MRDSDKVAAQKIGFLLLKNFTLISFASAIEPLRMANQYSGQELYEWYVLTEDGAPICASDGVQVTPDTGFANSLELDILIVVGGIDITRTYTAEQVSWLQLQGRKGCRLGAICTGAYVLAHAGLLDGYACSTHWEYMASLQETYPKVKCTNRLFTFDRDRMTSSGGTVPMDMMLTMIQQEHGYLLSAAISDMFLCDRVRSEADSQKIPLRHVLGTSQPKLTEVVALMEANIEEAIELDQLAQYVGLSRRQLERLFQKYLDCSPSRYYLKLRLLRARQLLKQTSMPVVDIVAACGFVSIQHFRKCYREQIGIPPSSERAMLVTPCNQALIPVPVAVLRKVDADVVDKESASVEALAKAESEPSFGSVELP